MADYTANGRPCVRVKMIPHLLHLVLLGLAWFGSTTAQNLCGICNPTGVNGPFLASFPGQMQSVDGNSLSSAGKAALVQGSYRLEIVNSDVQLSDAFDSRRVLWRAGASGPGRTDLIMQPDGDVVLYHNRQTDGTQGSPTPITRTQNRGQGPYCFLLATNRQLALYDSQCTILWAAGTTLFDRPANPDGTCKTHKVRENQWCQQVADENGIDLPMLNRYNNFDCLKDLALGLRLCVSLGVKPPPPIPPANPDGSCRFVEVGKDGGDCWALSKSCGPDMDLETFQAANPGLSCSNNNPTILFQYQRFCCSQGQKPSRRLSPQNGNCAWREADPNEFYSCAVLASRFDVTVDEIEAWNKNNWRWTGCGGMQTGARVCLSDGLPPPPKINPEAQCGMETVGNLECPLKACCGKWGYCGATPDFCTEVPGPPGNGCQQNCGMTVPVDRHKCGPQTMQIRVGYYQSWAVGRTPGKCRQYQVTDIVASKWTHIHYAFAVVTEDFRLDVESDMQRQQLTDMQRLKLQNPNIKLIISVGGWAFNDPPTQRRFTDMASTPQNRARFIQSSRDFLLTYRLDGLDIDWEYPGADDRNTAPGLPTRGKEDTVNYLALIRELRQAFGGWGGWSLSIAAPASQWYLKWFDIAEMAKELDYIVYMTYDLHGAWDYRIPSIGPLLNAHNNWTEVEQTMVMVTKAGVDTSKILLGIGFYARSFKLEDPECNYPGCPWSDPGIFDGQNYPYAATPGECTKSGGTLAYFEIMDMIRAGNFEDLTYDEPSKSQLLTYRGGTEWVGFDDMVSMGEKLKAAQELCLGGIIVWSVDQDDTDESLLSEIEGAGNDISSVLAGFRLNIDPGGDGKIPEIFYTRLRDAVIDFAATHRFTPADVFKTTIWGMAEMYEKITEQLYRRMALPQMASSENGNRKLLTLQANDPNIQSCFRCYVSGRERTCPRGEEFSDGRRHDNMDQTEYEWRVVDGNKLRTLLGYHGINYNDVEFRTVKIKNFPAPNSRHCMDFTCPSNELAWGGVMTIKQVTENGKNYFTSHAYDLYAEAVRPSMEQELRNTAVGGDARAYWQCSGPRGPVACPDTLDPRRIPDHDITWNVAPGMNDELIFVLETVSGVPSESLGFGDFQLAYSRPGIQRPCPPQFPGACWERMPIVQQITWRNFPFLASNYPPKMDVIIADFYQTAKQRIEEVRSVAMDRYTTLIDASTVVDTLTYFMATADNLVDVERQYEDIVEKKMEEEERRKDAVAELIVMIALDIVLAFVLPGVGEFIAVGMHASRAAKWIYTAVKDVRIVRAISNELKALANMAQRGGSLVRDSAAIRAILQKMGANMPNWIKTVGGKMKTSVTEIGQFAACMTVDTYVIPKILPEINAATILFRRSLAGSGDEQSLPFFIDANSSFALSDYTEHVRTSFPEDFEDDNDHEDGTDRYVDLHERNYSGDPPVNLCPFDYKNAHEFKTTSQTYNQHCTPNTDMIYFSNGGYTDVHFGSVAGNRLAECDHIWEPQVFDLMFKRGEMKPSASILTQADRKLLCDAFNADRNPDSRGQRIARRINAPANMQGTDKLLNQWKAKLVSDDKTTLHQNWQGQYGLGNRARGTPTTPFSKVPEAMELYINRMETRWKDTTNDIRDILKEFEDKVENGNDPGLKATWNKVLMLHGTPSDRHGVSNFFQKSSAAVIDDMRLRVGNAKTFFANKDATFTDKYVDDVTPNRPHSEHWRTGGTNTGIVPIVAKPGDPSPGVKRKRENIPDDANKTRSKAIRPGSANQIKQICGAKV